MHQPLSFSNAIMSSPKQNVTTLDDHKIQESASFREFSFPLTSGRETSDSEMIREYRTFG